MEKILILLLFPICILGQSRDTVSIDTLETFPKLISDPEVYQKEHAKGDWRIVSFVQNGKRHYLVIKTKEDE